MAAARGGTRLPRSALDLAYAREACRWLVERGYADVEWAQAGDPFVTIHVRAEAWPGPWTEVAPQ